MSPSGRLQSFSSGRFRPRLRKLQIRVFSGGSLPFPTPGKLGGERFEKPGPVVAPPGLDLPSYSPDVMVRIYEQGESGAHQLEANIGFLARKRLTPVPGEAEAAWQQGAIRRLPLPEHPYVIPAFHVADGEASRCPPLHTRTLRS